MVRGFYTAGSGILTNTRKLDVVANNLSNSQTAGYKQDTAVTESFGESLALKIDGVSQTGIGNIG
jgi:flagellar basal-body rod protein FlgG